MCNTLGSIPSIAKKKKKSQTNKQKGYAQNEIDFMIQK
jgi:hypothetical protein